MVVCKHTFFPSVKLPWTVNLLTLHTSAGETSVQRLADHSYFHPTEQMLQLYAYGTFCDIQKRWFAISPPHWHSTTRAPCYDRISLFFPLSAPSFFPSQGDGTGCGCHSPAVRLPYQHLSPSLSPWGTADNTWSPEPDSQLEHSKRAFS